MSGNEALIAAVTKQGKRLVDARGNFVYFKNNVPILEARNGFKYESADAFREQFAPFREEYADEMTEEDERKEGA